MSANNAAFRAASDVLGPHNSARRVFGAKVARPPRTANLKLGGILFPERSARYEDQAPAGPDPRQATGREGGQEGRYHHPRHGQGKAPGGRGGRGGAWQGGR